MGVTSERKPVRGVDFEWGFGEKGRQVLEWEWWFKIGHELG